MLGNDTAHCRIDLSLPHGGMFMVWSIVLSVLGATALITSPPGPYASNPAGAKQLNAAKIRKALIGKSVSYSPPGSADAGLHEEYHSDGTWRGALYGAAIIGFTGRWIIKDGELCVTADPRTIAEHWHAGQYCRQVWRDRGSSQLRMIYLTDQPSSSHNLGPQILHVRDLKMPPAR